MSEYRNGLPQPIPQRLRAPPTGRALIDWWLGKLGKAERAFLDFAVQSHPRSFTKEDLSEATGYSMTSSSFTNALGKLRTLQLLHGRVEMRASDNLF